MPLKKIELSEFQTIAKGVHRPEDIVATRHGPVYCSHHGGAVAQISSDGTFTVLGPKCPGAPNGINMDAKGRIIIANFGVDDHAAGPLEIYDPAKGTRSVLVNEVDGRSLTACNYPVIDRAGNIWCSHSTSAGSWWDALDRRADGFIFVLRPDGSTQIVAEGLRFANGMALSGDERFLYCTQTSNGDVLRYPVLPGATLGPAEKYGPSLGFVLGMKANPKLKIPKFFAQFLGYTDGIGFDVAGNLWVTLPTARKIVAITPQGKKFTVAHDPSGQLMQSPTNIAWGGPDLTDLYVGDIQADYILKAKSPVAGMAMLHHEL